MDDLVSVVELILGLLAALALLVLMARQLNLPYPILLVLGAVVAPTDESAVVPIVHRLRVRRRIVTIIEDESLVNDAVSLVIYRLAVAAVVRGVFSLAQAGIEFVLVSLGGVAIGLAAGW